MTDSLQHNIESLSADAEALRALVLATYAERDAAVTERDTLLTQSASPHGGPHDDMKMWCGGPICFNLSARSCQG